MLKKQLVPLNRSSEELQETYRKVLKRVEILSPRFLDSHEITMSLLEETSWDIRHAMALVQFRIRDALSERKRGKHFDLLNKEVVEIETNSVNDSDILTRLISLSNLTNEQREILFLRFWRGLSIEQLSLSLSKPSSHITEVLWLVMEKLREARRGLEGDKDNTEGD